MSLTALGQMPPTARGPDAAGLLLGLGASGDTAEASCSSREPQSFKRPRNDSSSEESSGEVGFRPRRGGPQQQQGRHGILLGPKVGIANPT